MVSPRQRLCALGFFLWSVCTRETAAAAGVPSVVESYIHSPSSRIVRPVSLYQRNGSVSVTADGTYLLRGPNSSITYDFGQETGGYLTIEYGARTSKTSTTGLPSGSCAGSCQALGLGYSESAAFVEYASDDTGILNLADGVVYLPLEQSDYAVPTKWGRGGFRYLTLSLGSTTDANTVAEIKGATIYFTPEPNVPDNELRNYTGYFHCSDELLNRIWYAGAYTAQMVTISTNSSVNDTYLPGSIGWDQDEHPEYLGANDMFLADGAKRDRAPFSGDLSVSMRTLIAARDYDNLSAAKSTLTTLIKSQDPVTGYFPWAGSPIASLFGSPDSPFSEYGSDTYHLYTILGFSQYVLLTSDLDFARAYWPAINRGIQAVYPFIDNSSGLFNSTRTQDWGRANQGGLSSSVNAIFYGTLNTLVRVSALLPNEPSTPAKWIQMASLAKQSANSLLWDSKTNLFAENSTTQGFELQPLDGNSFALVYNLTSTRSRARKISAALRARWIYPYGSPTPELTGTISPFVSSSELLGHFLANPRNSSDAIALIRLQWGYMLQAFSNTTLVEGYGTDGTLNYGFTGPTKEALVSHAHGWSTGPTWSLIEFVAGLRATPLSVGVAAPAEKNVTNATATEGNVGWIFQPQIMGSGLSSAQAGYTLPNVGTFSVAWTLVKDGELQMSLSTPPAAKSGTILVPLFGSKGKNVMLEVNGKSEKGFPVEQGFAMLSNVPAGDYNITLNY